MLKMTAPEDVAASTPLRPLDDQAAQSLVDLFKLFADETRVRILYFLRHSPELNVQNICELLGQTQPAVSHHLAILRASKLIAMRRQGKHNFYHLLPERFDELRSYVAMLEPSRS